MATKAAAKTKAPGFAELGAARADKVILREEINKWFLPIQKDMKANHHQEYFSKKVVIAVDGYDPILITYRDFLMMVIASEADLVRDINSLARRQRRIREGWDRQDRERGEDEEDDDDE